MKVYLLQRERKKEKKEGERERELIVLTINYFVFNYTLFCVLKRCKKDPFIGSLNNFITIDANKTSLRRIITLVR